MGVSTGSTGCQYDAQCIRRHGNCSHERHIGLQQEVDRQCKYYDTCTQADECPTLLDKAGKRSKCADARKRINNACFDGGDPDHIGAREDALGAFKKCLRIYREKCGPKRKSVPIPHELVDRIKEATGLTGAALVAYILVSELSRLFPPRNLIPIP